MGGLERMMMVRSWAMEWMRDLGLCLGAPGRGIFIEGNVNGRNR